MSDARLIVDLQAALQRGYGIDDIVRLEEVGGRRSHLSWLVERAAAPTLFCKAYHGERAAEALARESAALLVLEQRGFASAPRLLRLQGGAQHLADENLPWPCCLMTALPGKRRFELDEAPADLGVIENSAALLAAFHDALAGTDEPAALRGPSLADQFPALTAGARAAMQRAPYLAAAAPHAARLFAARPSAPLIHCRKGLLHGDFHPGNLHFDGDIPVGLFDLEYAACDYLALDVAMGAVCFSGLLGGLELEEAAGRAALFIAAYRSSARLGLAAEEDDDLPFFTALAQLLIVKWCLDQIEQTGAREPYRGIALKAVRHLG